MQIRLTASLILLSVLLSACQASNLQDDKPGHLKPFGQQGPNHPVDSVDGLISPAEFLENYVKQNRPLLFRGGAKASPAFEKWTDAYLAERTPPRPAGDVFIEHNKKENRSQGYSYLHFKEFLRIYNTSDIYMVSQVPSFLLEDLVVPYPLQCRFFVQGGLDTHVAWFSSGGTSSVIHTDTYENINCLLRGRKSLVFLNTTRYADQVEKMLDKPEKGYSSADVDSIDVEARPEFSGLEFHSAEMQAGDCLYIPNVWFHQVRSFENNLAVNLWWFQRDEYDISGCATKFDPNLRFNMVSFARLYRAARDDAMSIRAVLATWLKPPVSQTDFLNFLSRGDADSLAKARPEFPSAVAKLFKAFDLDKDGALSDAEFKDRLKLKDGMTIKRAVTAYNVQVFAMQEAAASSKDAAAINQLPKLFGTSDSDELMFSLERTWFPAEVDSKSNDKDSKDAAKSEL